MGSDPPTKFQGFPGRGQTPFKILRLSAIGSASSILNIAKKSYVSMKKLILCELRTDSMNRLLFLFNQTFQNLNIKNREAILRRLLVFLTIGVPLFLYLPIKVFLTRKTEPYLDTLHTILYNSINSLHCITS